MAGEYTFGDTDLAARRLGLVAEVFEPPTRALLESSGLIDRRAVVDLGCGPGYTTRLIAEVCRPERVVGLDASDRFVDIARAGTADPTVTYAVKDITEIPFPAPPQGRYDGLFARLLLAHLPDPLGLIDRWRTQVAPDGVLVLDEIESMTPPPGVLTDYETLVVALVAAEGGSMYAGPLLAPLGGRCVEWPVDAGLAARMYAMNLATWRTGAERRGLATTAELDALAAGLDRLQAGGTGAKPVEWVLRQLVLDA